MADSNPQISAQENAIANKTLEFRVLQITHALNSLFKLIDKNNSSFIEQEEFQEFLDLPSSVPFVNLGVSQLYLLATAFPTDKEVDIESLRKQAQSASSYFSWADRDRDSKLSYKEFVNLFLDLSDKVNFIASNEEPYFKHVPDSGPVIGRPSKGFPNPTGLFESISFLLNPATKFRDLPVSAVFETTVFLMDQLFDLLKNHLKDTIDVSGFNIAYGFLVSDIIERANSKQGGNKLSKFFDKDWMSVTSSEQVFDTADVNHDGYLDRNEWNHFLVELYASTFTDFEALETPPFLLAKSPDGKAAITNKFTEKLLHLVVVLEDQRHEELDDLAMNHQKAGQRLAQLRSMLSNKSIDTAVASNVTEEAMALESAVIAMERKFSSLGIKFEPLPPEEVAPAPPVQPKGNRRVSLNVHTIVPTFAMATQGIANDEADEEQPTPAATAVNPPAPSASTKSFENPLASFKKSPLSSASTAVHTTAAGAARFSDRVDDLATAAVVVDIDNIYERTSGVFGKVPKEAAKVVHCGFAHKKAMGKSSLGFYRPWANRFFVLTSDRMLSYYDGEGGKLKGQEFLHAGIEFYALDANAPEAEGRPHALVLTGINPIKYRGAGTLIISASSQIQLFHWLSALDSIGGLRHNLAAGAV